MNPLSLAEIDALFAEQIDRTQKDLAKCEADFGEPH